MALTNPMKIVPLNCCQCSALLNASEEVRQVLCQHCGSQLAVLHEGSAAYTESREPKPMEVAIEQLLEESEQQRELAVLDRQWQKERRQYMVIVYDGTARVPSSSIANDTVITSFVGGLLFVFIAWLFSDNLLSFVGGCLLIGLFVVIGLGLSRLQHQRSAAYQEAERCYRRRRLDLIEKPEAFPSKGWG
ncbi:hypothetical protein [Bremerella cremea]|uniref:hypothetical protein n=1 Tax=Bremerella cremea TaxID=1031537 RepID=UPI001313ED9E|nr:hypothetical protein [Bremerella cremea]